MAIVRVDFSRNQPAEFAPAISGIINSTMQGILAVPQEENYILCQAYEKGAILHAPGICPPERIDMIVFIQITLNQGRSTDLKTRFFRELSLNLAATGFVQAENIYINLVEVARENWSFGSLCA